MSENQSYTEVCITAESGEEYIYWVSLKNMPCEEDDVDWAIERAIAYHLSVGGEPIAEQGDDFDPVTACEPFDRDIHEYVVVEPEK
jgi:hypothetical protein